MSDNDRKNPYETKQDHELYDPIKKAVRTLNPNQQNENKNSRSSVKSGNSKSQVSETSSTNDYFDLSFLEAEPENDLISELPFDDHEQQWNLQSDINTLDSEGITKQPVADLPEEIYSSSGTEHFSSFNDDEEQILNALSPLPIQKNNFNEQQCNALNVQQNCNDKQKTHTTSINTPYETAATQQNFSENSKSKIQKPYATTNISSTSSDAISNKSASSKNKSANVFSSTLNSEHIDKLFNLKHSVDDSELNEQKTLKQGNADTKTLEYSVAPTQPVENDINNIENIFDTNNNDISYDRNDLDYTHTSSECLNTQQIDNFPARNHTYGNNPPPNVDTCKFAEEIVEKTEQIIGSEVSYTIPKYDVSSDNLEKEFSDVFNVGNVSTEDLSQQQQNEILDEIFHQHKHNSRVDSYMDHKEQNANNLSTDNKEYYSSSFTENLQHDWADEISSNLSETSSSRNFMIRKIITRGAILFILIAVSLFGYSYFLTPSHEDEEALIIHADNTPFKTKPETTEIESNITHNLDVYKQITEQNENTQDIQPFLVDNSETPEDLTALNEQISESTSSSSLNESNIEDAITAAIDRTIPTREVQTIIVKPDGTTVLMPAHHTDENSIDSPEVIDTMAVDQLQDNASVPTQSADINSVNANNMEAKHNLLADIEEKTRKVTIPIPSSAKFSSNTQAQVASRPNTSAHITTQNSENYYVQLASHPTSDLANASAKIIKSKLGFLIGSRPLNIQSAFIPGKGTYYRVRVQTQSRNEAISLCEKIKNSGENCFITR